jgi:uncharacterized protein DUF1570
MKRLLLLLVVAIGSTSALARADREDQGSASRRGTSWNRVVAGDVVALGDASEKALRERVEQIASFRAALAQLYPDLRVDSPVPYRVVLFPSPAALQRYVPRDERGRPRPFVSGYFGGDADLNVIALGSGQADVLFHEFAHSFLSRNFHALPEWLEEGLAEFLSTFDADRRKKQGLIGLAPATRHRSLRTLPYLPIKEFVLATSRDLDRLWRDSARTEMFYAEAWALVHYLQIGRRSGAPDDFGRFVVALDRGAPVEQAFRAALGASLEQIDEELRHYGWRSGQDPDDHCRPGEQAVIGNLAARLRVTSSRRASRPRRRRSDASPRGCYWPRSYRAPCSRAHSRDTASSSRDPSAC